MIRLPKNKVLIQPRFDPDTTVGGLYIPDIAKERSDQGIVKYIGPKVEDVKVGDYVLFSGYDGVTIQFPSDGEGVLILLHEPFIKAIFGNINTEVPGLFFKSRLEEDEIKKELAITLSNLKHDLITVDEAIDSSLRTMGKYDPYFQATYEIAIQIIMEAFSADPNKITIHNKLDDREKQPHLLEK